MQRREGTIVLDDQPELSDSEQIEKIKNGGKITEEEFEKLQKNFDLKSVLSKLTIRKEAFIVSRNSTVHNDYEFGQKLGNGTYGEVFRGIHKATGEPRAIKRIPKEKIVRFEQFYNEVMSLKTLDH